MGVNRYDSPTKQNNFQGYYDSANKPSYSSAFSDILNLSPTSSVASSPTPSFPISVPAIRTPHRNYPRIALPPINALSPLPEEFPHYSNSHHHLSTLPRSRRLHYDVGGGDEDDDRLLREAPYGSGGGMASVGDRYHLMHEVKANPKYVVRRPGAHLDDESFV